MLPRHQKILDYLASHTPTTFTIEELSRKLALSKKVLRNELPKLHSDGHVKRKIVGRTYEYYLTETPSKYRATYETLKPLTQAEVAEIASAAAAPDYVPLSTKLAWTLPQALSEVLRAAISETPLEPSLRTDLSPVVDALDGMVSTLKRLLATSQLWTDPTWLNQNQPEKNLEIIEQVACALETSAARLMPAPNTTTPTGDTND